MLKFMKYLSIALSSFRIAQAIGDPTTTSKLETLPTMARLIPGQYVTILASTTEISEFVESVPVDEFNNNEPLLTIRYRYNHSSPSSTVPMRGVAVSNVYEKALEWLLGSDLVASVIPDYAFDLDRIQMSPESWGLDRLDEESLPMDNQYHYEQDGSGVDVYILDTGIYRDHMDFSALLEMGNTIHSQHRNISCGYDAFEVLNKETSTSLEELCVDTSGHGTHIAAIIGGRHNGVAKHTNLISVKVYDTEKGASLSTVLAGLDYVLSKKLQDPTRPTVVNLSLGAPRCELMNLMAMRLVEDAGVVMVVSAGNDASTSCNKSPASAGLPIITVSTTDHLDNMPRYANYGACINLLAPGHAITSAWIRHPRDVVRLSGTSLAAPHVTGVVAQYLQRYPRWKPHEVWTAIEVNALRGVVTNVPESTPNLLLNTGDLRDPFYD